MGFFSGYTSQGTASIAIGCQSGVNSQASNSIVIFSGSDGSVSQDSSYQNSIVINASSTAITVSSTGLYIKPVRATVDVAPSNIKQVYYNFDTGEFFYYNV